MTLKTSVSRGREKLLVPFVLVYGEHVLTKSVNLPNVEARQNLYF